MRIENNITLVSDSQYFDGCFVKVLLIRIFTEDNLIEENSRVIDAIERHISDNLDNVNLIDTMFEFN